MQILLSLQKKLAKIGCTSAKHPNTFDVFALGMHYPGIKFSDIRQMKVSKTRYLQIFLSVTIVLALVRCVCPQVSGNSKGLALADSTSLPTDSMAANDSVAQQNSVAKDDNDNQEVSTTDLKPMAVKSRFFKADGTLTKNRIFSVPGFSKTFPDQNDVQLAAATQWGG